MEVVVWTPREKDERFSLWHKYDDVCSVVLASPCAKVPSRISEHKRPLSVLKGTTDLELWTDLRDGGWQRRRRWRNVQHGFVDVTLFDLKPSRFCHTHLCTFALILPMDQSQCQNNESHHVSRIENGSARCRMY